MWGAWLSHRQLRRTPKSGNRPRTLEPITILKPLKGVEEALEANLESFFGLDYPDYELVFCVTTEDDPSVPIVRNLLARFPKQRAQLLVTERTVGPNPKVNNMITGYENATHDWILISDSNVRVTHDYLRLVTAEFTTDVGIVTAIVAGVDPQAAGAWLESVFLNTFYARWMVLSRWMGIPVVVGKSMLFRKSDARRFGGLAVLGRYLAEDYMAGQAMKLLGRQVEIMLKPICQPLGRYSMSAFWSRHLRWGRIRKSQAPQAFALEPFLSFWVSGVAGSLACGHLLDVPAWHFFLLHATVWLGADYWMMHLVAPNVLSGSRSKFVLAWFARETLHLPLWIHIAIGRTVKWRGRKLVLARGGILKTRTD